MSSENLAIYAIFSRWQNETDDLFDNLFSQHEIFAGTVFSIKNKKLFLRLVEEKDFEIEWFDRPGQRVIKGFSSKNADKNICIYEIIHYHREDQMMYDVRNCLSEVSGIPEELFSLQYKHIIFIVPGTNIVMDIVDEKPSIDVPEKDIL
jgi:hypothetical protein